MIERQGYAIGNQKIVKFFEHKGKRFVRLEDQVGWNKRDVLLTFHLARIAHLFFPNNIPYPRLVRKSNRKEGTYSIFAEYILHDKDHEFITQFRNDNLGGRGNLSNEDLKRLRLMVEEFEKKETVLRLREKFKLSGLIGSAGGGFELIKQNVIMKEGCPVFIDFINPFAISTIGNEETWIPRVDFQKIYSFASKKCDDKTKNLIVKELENIFKWIPEKVKERYYNILK